MLAQLHFDSVRALAVAGTLAVLYLAYFIIQYTRNELRIRRLGVRAPILAKNPLTGLRWFIGAARAQLDHRLFQYFEDLFLEARGAATGDDCVEVQVMPAGGERYIITRDPEHVKAVLAGQFAQFGKGQGFHDLWSPFLGDSIFTTDGPRWHDSRSLIRPMFVKDRVSDLVVFERWTAALLRQIERQRRGLLEKDGHSKLGGTVEEKDGDGAGDVVDIQSLFYRMTLDVTTDFLLGAAVDSLSNPRDEFAEAFNEVQRLQMYLTILGPFQGVVPRGRYRAGLRAIDRFVMPYIEAALALPAGELEKRTSSDSRFTFLHSVARHTRDPKVLRDQIVAVLLAGRDTTAATLSWAVYELSRYPAKVARLRAEIRDAVGPASATPSYDNLKNMPYLRHVLNETLRLYPAVPYNLRVALEDTTLPSTAAGGQPGPPIAVLKDDAVVYSTLSMQRRRNLYPSHGSDGGHFADPALFVPERWESWNPKPWTYVPFNGGPRICVGQNFALTEMAYVLVRLLQKYERIEYIGDWSAQFHEPEIVGKPGQGVKVRLHEAANAPPPT